MSKSIWSSLNEYPKTNILDKNMKCDVLVIGGGICGVLITYMLSKNKVDTILVEKNKLGSGITKNTTAVLSAQQEILYKDRIKKTNADKAKMFYNANMMAIEEFDNLSKEYSFEFERISSYIYNKNKDNELKEEYEVLKDLGIDAYYHEIDLPFNAVDAIEFKNQAQINPLKLINELSHVIDYYDNTEIIDIRGNKAFTNGGNEIEFNKVIYATHFPPFKLKGLFSLKMYQKKSYVISFQTDNIIKDSYVGMTDDNIYSRSYKNYLLVGANDIKTGCKNQAFKTVEKYIKSNYVDYKITHKWINQDCITLDDMPYIGKISENEFVATGFNMWGMTSSMISAVLIKDLITNNKNEYEKLFNPKRVMYMPQLFKNIWNAIKGIVSLKTPRCPHLGSKLVYMDADGTYECPCHGSKFDGDGDIITNPSKKSIKTE